MTSDQNKLVVRRYIEEVINTGNVDRIAEFVSAEYVEVYRGIRSPVGVDGARKHVLDVRQTYPDLHLTIDRQIAEGDWVVTQVTARGTHRGSWLGMGRILRALAVPCVRPSPAPRGGRGPAAG